RGTRRPRKEPRGPDHRREGRCTWQASTVTAVPASQPASTPQRAPQTPPRAPARTASSAAAARQPDDGPGPEAAVDLAERLLGTVGAAVRGKDAEVRLALVALLSGGHLLVEDLPGTGKTLLAKSLATALGGRFGRVQCTPDLLPSDITGTSVYSPVDG